MAQRPDGKLYFRGLDLVRGIAALAVLVYHVDFAFGLRGQLLPGGYTAVDLFFILSGFVIAMTYEDAVARKRIDFWGITVRRLARLYPLYLLTTCVGLVVMTVRFRSIYGFFDRVPLTISAIANLLFLPTPHPAYGSGVLFPFNAASWSIFYELVINLVFFFLFAHLRTRNLVVLWVVSGAAVAWVIAHFGNIDVGWGAPNFVAAFARVWFSFLTGMLIWRRYKAAPWSTATWIVCGLIAAHLVFMQGRLWMPPTVASVADFAVVTTLLPLVVIAGVGTLMGRSASKVSGFLGDTSYAVYLTQDALIIAAAGLTQFLLKTKIYDFAPVAGLVLVTLCVAESYLCFKYFEMPMRRWLRHAGRAEKKTEARGEDAAFRGPS